MLAQDDDSPLNVSQADRSADSGQSMSRKRSRQCQSQASPFLEAQNNGLSKPVDYWLSTEAPFSTYRPMQTTGPTDAVVRNHRLSRPTAVTSFEPSEYHDHVKRNSSRPRPDNFDTFDLRRISRNNPLSPYPHSTSTLSSSPFSEAFPSPADNHTDATSVSMSRATSKASNSFCKGFNRMRLASSMSRDNSSIGQNEKSFHSSLGNHLPREPSATISPPDYRQTLSHTGGAVDNKALADAFDYRLPTNFGMDEVDTQDTGPTDSDTSTTSRLFRRSKEHVASSSRILAPKSISSLSTAIPMAQQSSQATSHDMSRTPSDERTNGQVAISRLPWTRPLQNPFKVKCSECDQNENGFKGEHELKRHILRAHRPTRKVFVCIDPEPLGAFLSDCGNCNSFKRYNAYYNAAAHLRRKHFNKKLKGERKKGKLPKAERRGGKGGGKEPEMTLLKQYMREFEIYADGTPLDDADMTYSTPASITASAQQSSRVVEKTPGKDLSYHSPVKMHHLEVAQVNDGDCTQPASQKTSTPIPIVVAEPFDAQKSSKLNSPISPSTDDYSPTSLPLSANSSLPLLHHVDTSVNEITDPLADTFDPPPFDDMSHQSFEQLLELDLDMFPTY